MGIETVLRDQIATLERQLAESQEEQRRLGIDDVTGAPTRGSLNVALERMAADAIRSHESFGVLMIDVDNFKRINDNFGHPAGDMLLTRISNAIRASIRASDMYGRYGGDEFTVCTGALDSPAQLYQLAERIRGATMQHGVLLSPITVSIGGSFCNTGSRIVSDSGLRGDAERVVWRMVKHADSMLYTVKCSGRNNACIYQEECV